MAEPLWTPSRADDTNLTRFMYYLAQRYRLSFSDYPSLYQWSVSDIPRFWAALWDFLEIKAREPFTEVVDDLTKMPGARWFIGAKINFAENLLRHRDESPALISWGERGKREVISYGQLYKRVSSLVASLQNMGIKPGDRVVGFMPNIPEAVMAMLAATALGAVWSSCSPDFGFRGVLDRFGQIEPRILFGTSGYLFKGKVVDVREKLGQIVREIPSVEKVIITPFEGDSDISAIPKSQLLADFCSEPLKEIPFVHRGFDHPVYIMYSSGTTGLPKCIVQGPGVLINHLKEHVLHCDLKRGDRTFYFTTCGWMMWNWLVSGLAVGAGVVLYDGNPFYPSSETLWKMAEEENLRVFGASAGYLTALQNQGVKPREISSFPSLRTILSTGSPLSDEGFEYVYRDIKRDVQLSSISGGTDLNGCFALGSPHLPVYSGELQCRGLGMKVEVFDEEGKSVVEETGELVCTAPFPSMPLFFWKDPGGKKYHQAYFNHYPGVWCHGDFAKVTHRGGMVISGRSDATLNPGGVRIGTAEIYRVLEKMEEIEDSVVVGQAWKGSERVILFVKLRENQDLSGALKKAIRSTIKEKISPRHIPAIIFPVPDIPYTINMKKVEVAIKKILEGREVQGREALKNPEALDFFRNIPELME